MRTNKKITFQAFEEMHETYYKNKNYEEKLDELMLIFQNNDSRYYLDFMASKRTRAHSAAFYSVILALKPFLPVGYYASNEQIKQNILHFWGMNYKEFLDPLVQRIEEERKEYLDF